MSVVYSIDSKLILSGSMDKTTKIWNIEKGNEIASLLGYDKGV